MVEILYLPEKYNRWLRKSCRILLREARCLYHDHGLLEMLNYLFFPEREVEKILAEQLRQRPEDIDTYWDAVCCDRNVINTICDIIKNVMYWPNAKYLPDDPLALLTMFWWDEDRLTYIIIAIEDKYGSILDKQLDIDMDNVSLGELIELFYTKISHTRDKVR